MPPGWLSGAAASALPRSGPHSSDILPFFNDTRLLSPQVLITITIYGILKDMPGPKIRALHSLSCLIPTRRTCGVRRGGRRGWPAGGHQAGSGGHPPCPAASVSGGAAGHRCCAAPERRRSCLSPRRARAFLGRPSDPGQAPRGPEASAGQSPSRAGLERGNHRHLRDPDPCQVGHFPPPDLAGDREEPAQRVRKGVEEVRAGRGPGVGALGGPDPVLLLVHTLSWTPAGAAAAPGTGTGVLGKRRACGSPS